MPVIFCPREFEAGETRVALTPESGKKFIEAGFSVLMEKGAGEAAGFSDSHYEEAGCRSVGARAEGFSSADIVIGVHPLPDETIALLRRGAFSVGFLDPFRNPEKIAALAAVGVTAASLELIPRTTLAQKMDALSSQASLAGYAAVLLAATRLDKALPMMMTPAGTLQPARFFIVGAGVAGLQAIATAKRLGARVTAFDTRPVVEEQVRSLGARFFKIDLGETGQTEQGYAKELSAAQIEIQRKAMARACAESDAIITTAQVFGRAAPRILSKEMLCGMRPGSVVVDMAVGTGGNVEGSEPGREVVQEGVRIFGAGNLPATVPHHASQLLANNLFHYISHVWKGAAPDLAAEDGIARDSIVTHDGKIINARVLATQSSS